MVLQQCSYGIRIRDIEKLDTDDNWSVLNGRIIACATHADIHKTSRNILISSAILQQLNNLAQLK